MIFFFQLFKQVNQLTGPTKAGKKLDSAPCAVFLIKCQERLGTERQARKPARRLIPLPGWGTMMVWTKVMAVKNYEANNFESRFRGTANSAG